VALIEAFTDQITAAFATQHLGTSVAGRVTVVLDGQGSLAELAIDEGWLTDASPSGINANLSAALASAREGLTPDPVTAALDDSRLGRMVGELTTL
jgi:DNA-binding protein YbaB